MIATGSSVWNGSFHEGSGSISTALQTLRERPYTFASRFEGAEGGSPEELLAAAHAGCYNHALANIFRKNGLSVGTIRTRVEVDMGSDAVSPGIQGVHITVDAHMPDVSDERFRQFAERAARTCAISKALSVDITLTATLARAQGSS
ncbi:osmotically inducible protein OsmC [Streptomyces aurantiacus]|uniref:OsmC family peroxiredoxin n=1 Tax=Streptomyces aurantiacus TaxID=47760 RepID=UPI00278D3DD9|nr:OsmC family peroxiredoxin [Streptomyces aurantiacus]MDQ0771736.1 osmotically inducible protein OsmC [Streptomyces aurantiacus]